ncbi:MAG: T9SS type A sorting domain-containing protein [Saprospiraceae bacterium]|nr:T9SS type A sorting domain-containing protein [Saprospiraceae bacterium]
MFPNPTSGAITLKHADQFNSIKVIDLQGKVQFAANSVKEEYDFSHLSAGVYWIQLTNDTQSISKKLIIQNGN